MENFRAKAPRITKNINPRLPDIERAVLDNGLNLVIIRGGTEPVMKLEIVFRSGRPFEHKKQVSRLMCQMLMEGTNSTIGKVLSEKFDFYGSNISPFISMDHTGLTLYCLEKHAEFLLPYMMEMLLEPSFVEEEFIKLKKNAQEKLSLDLSKNDFVAYREMTIALFGPDHFYGYNSSEEIIKSVETEDLREHFNRTYQASNGIVFLSGNFTRATIDLVSDYMGRLPKGGVCEPKPVLDFTPFKSEIQVKSPNKHQVALRIGRKLFPRNHIDFNKLYIVNTILGGYFGSRLMSQIREEKGFTYNVYSSIENLLFDGSLIISMETDAVFLKDSIDMIRKELDLLRRVPVKKSELSMVKTYLLGYLLTAMDGPLNVSELIRNLMIEGSGLDSFDHLVSAIHDIDPLTIQEISEKYLNYEEMTTVVVGG
jgi:predicted Zn-dependent peptidase